MWQEQTDFSARFSRRSAFSHEGDYPLKGEYIIQMFQSKLLIADAMFGAKPKCLLQKLGLTGTIIR